MMNDLKRYGALKQDRPAALTLIQAVGKPSGEAAAVGAETALPPCRGTEGGRLGLIPEDKEDFDAGGLREDPACRGKRMRRCPGEARGGAGHAFAAHCSRPGHGETSRRVGSSSGGRPED